MTQTLVTPTTACGRCGDPVIVTVDGRHYRKVLDPEPVLGGLYELDQRGVAVRRQLRQVAAEYRHGSGPGGLAAHECGTRSTWA